jgi:hypothetical protein
LQAWALWETGNDKKLQSIKHLEAVGGKAWCSAKRQFKSSLGRFKEAIAHIMEWAEKHKVPPAAAAAAMDSEAESLGLSKSAGPVGRCQKLGLGLPQSCPTVEGTAASSGAVTPTPGKLVDRALQQCRLAQSGQQPLSLAAALEAAGPGAGSGSADGEAPSAPGHASFSLQGDLPEAEAALISAIPCGRELEGRLCKRIADAAKTGRRKPLEVKDAAHEVMLELPASFSQALTEELAREYSLEPKRDKVGWLSSYMLFCSCMRKRRRAASGESATEADVGELWKATVIVKEDGPVTRRRVFWELLAAAYSIGTGRVQHQVVSCGEGAGQLHKKARKD